MRFADVDEAKELSEMANRIWRDYYPAIVGLEETEFFLNTTQSEEAIREQIKEGYLYSFIIHEEKKVGYLCIHPEGDMLFMSKIYVSKEFRGNGLGSKALDEILERGKAMKLKGTYLRVNKNNAPAIDFYKHKGFVITAGEKRSFGNGIYMDDYKMEYTY